MTDMLDIFKKSFEQVLSEYARHRFILERDLVWTVQKRLLDDLADANDDYAVFNDFPVEKGKLNRGISVDLAILQKGIAREEIWDGKEQLELAVEFKFEPSPKRGDICEFKLPAVFWSAVVKDIERVRRFTENNKAKAGVAIFVDEFGRYKDETKYPVDSHSEWRHLGSFNTDYLDVWMLWTSFPASEGIITL